MNTPDGLLYSSEHEWVQREDGTNRVRIGITDYAQDALGDVVFVQIPEVGGNISAGDSVTEVESTKSVSDVYAPVSGTVVEVNDALSESPQLLNDDPYGDGWICVIEISEPDELDALMDAAAYATTVEG